MEPTKDDQIADEVYWFLSANEEYRRISDVASRGIGQPLLSKPDLRDFTRSWLSELALDGFALLFRYVAQDKDAQKGIPEKSRARLEELADELQALAPGMAEWESYETPERSDWKPLEPEHPDPGSGYSDEAAHTLNAVSRVCRKAARLLRVKWDYESEDPLHRYH